MEKVIDNFYDNPDTIREHALNQKYQKFTSVSYAGNDSIDRNIITDECKNKLQCIFDTPIQIPQARYRYARSKDYALGHIHSDIHTNHMGKGYHVLIYLSPGEENDSISFYEHTIFGKIPSKATFNSDKFRKDAFNIKKFKAYKTIQHVYNRAIILDYDYFHAPCKTHGFGEDITNCRLLHIIEIVLPHTEYT